MGVTKSFRIRSAGGTFLEANLAECVNVRRTPAARDKILRGEFHRLETPDGKASVEKELFYVDFDRDTYLLVKPRQERHRWDEASEQMKRMMAKLPDGLGKGGQRLQRVVFGLGELREKLVAQDAGLDDRMVELMKVMLVSEHPFLLKRTRLRILLERVQPMSVDFIACYDHSPRKFRLSLPRSIADDLQERRPEVERWVAKNHRDSVFAAAENTWINLWRWSPATTALNRLKKCAKDIRAGVNPNTKATGFKNMLKYLPNGSQLPDWAKRDLRDLFVWVKSKPGLAKLQDALFEIRFGRDLEDDWYLNNDPNDIDTLWKLLKDLPDANVEGNTALNEILLAEGEGGGWYEPGSHDIYIGSDELGDREGFEDVMRHEVGHAVHEMHDSLVTPWLEARFGWRLFEASSAGIDAWVGLMGGYGNITSQQRSEIRQYLIQTAGPGERWSPGPAPTAPVGHPWRAPNFGPRLACERTGANWFDNNANWYRRNGLAFFCNFYYRAFMTVSEQTLNLVNIGMPSTYAAMSPFEFFAELYALYYDLDDPQRGNVPVDVKTWLDQHVGVAASGQPAPPMLRSARTRTRPSKPR